MNRRKGLLLAVDDLEIGKLVAIHHASMEFRQLRGISLRIAAINLPFIVAKLVPRPDIPPLTLNVRECRFMPVTEDFAAAQTQEIAIVPNPSDNPPNQG